MRSVFYRIAAIAALIVLCGASNAWAAEVRVCNEGDATLEMMRLYESGMLSNQGKLAGWDPIGPGDCSRWYTIDFKTSFAFIHRRTDGTITNPVYTSSEPAERGLSRWLCAPLERSFEIEGDRDDLLSTYATENCPTGFTALVPSFGVRYVYQWNGSSTSLTVDVSGEDDGADRVVFAPPPPPPPPPPPNPIALPVRAQAPAPSEGFPKEQCLDLKLYLQHMHTHPEAWPQDNYAQERARTNGLVMGCRSVGVWID